MKNFRMKLRMQKRTIHVLGPTWRAHVMVAAMAASALSFGDAQAGPESAPAVAAPTTPPPSLSAAMRRVGAEEIASATGSTKISIFPFSYSAALSGPALDEETARFVRSTPDLLPPLARSRSRIGADLARIVHQSNGPHVLVYASKVPGHMGCVIPVSDGVAPEFKGLMEAAGMDAATVAEFALAHMAAHCAQYSEGVAALHDVALTGRVGLGRVQSNLLDVRLERLLMVGASRERMLEMDADRTRSAERYADAFAVISMVARGALTGKQLEGIVRWRAATGSREGPGTLDFLRNLIATVSFQPEKVAAIRSPGTPGFDAQNVAGFLKPFWKRFEAGELMQQDELLHQRHTKRGGCTGLRNDRQADSADPCA